MASSVLRARLIGWSPLPVGRARSGRFLSKEMTMMLEPQSLIVWLVIGLIAGWLAGQIVKGYGLGLVGNLVVGVVGHSSAVGSSASSTSISAAESLPQSSTLPLAQWCSWSLSVFSNGHSAVRVASRLRLVKAGAT